MKIYAVKFSTDVGKGLIVVGADSPVTARRTAQQALKEAGLDGGLETKHPEEIHPEVGACVFWEMK